MKNLHIIFISLFVSFSSLASPLPDFPFINVSGKGELTIKPNKAELTFSILTFDKNSEAAYQRLLTRTQEAVGILKNHGVVDEDIESFTINKETKRKRGEDYTDLDILGYQVFQTFTIELDSLEFYSEIMDSLLKLQNLEGLSTNFGVKEEAKLEKELFKLASEEAKSKAEVLSSSLNVELGNVYAITDGSNYPWDFGKLGLSGRNDVQMRRRVPPPPFGEPQLFIPKTISLRKTIHVIYRID